MELMTSVSVQEAGGGACGMARLGRGGVGIKGEIDEKRPLGKLILTVRKKIITRTH